MLFYKKSTISRYTLHKNERLKKRKEIDSLFRNGKTLNYSPFKIYYNVSASTELNVFLQFGVGVSKKFFKKAVSRNRIKRLIREAYRLQNISLKEILQKQSRTLKVFFNYTGKVLPDYNLISEKVAEILKKLETEVVKDEKD